MNIMTKLADDAKLQLGSSSMNYDLTINNIIIGKSQYIMHGIETVFDDMNFCLIILDNAYGFAYFQGEIDYDTVQIVNKNALEVLDCALPTHVRVALLDALYCILNQTTLVTPPRVFRGNIREKARQRAQALLDSVPWRSKLLILGAVTEIIDEAVRKDCSVHVFDLEKQKHGLEISTILTETCSDARLRATISAVDYVIATGMIFTSMTEDLVFATTRASEKKLILYMQTGAHFGPQLLQFGAEGALCELFPYYDFFGDTQYFMLRKNGFAR